MSDLTSKYQKWDAFVDSEDEGCTGGGHGGMDLDAVTGPAEEVERIRSAWGGGVGEQTTAERPKETTKQPPVPREASKEVRPVSGKPREFTSWDKFDADGMLLEMENEDLHDPEEAPSMVTATERLVNVDCVDYKKDREEYELDKELAERGADLKQRTSYRFNTAHSLKEEANKQLKGSPHAAIRTYRSAATCLAPCLSATPLMAPSLTAKVTNLHTAIHANLAQALLTTGDHRGSLAAADTALEATPEHEKALYRRAVCRVHLGEYKAALADVARLQGNPAAAKLRRQVEEKLAV